MFLFDAIMLKWCFMGVQFLSIDVEKQLLGEVI